MSINVIRLINANGPVNGPVIRTHLKKQRERHPLIIFRMLDSDIDPALGVVHAREWHFGALLFRKCIRHRVR